MPIRYHIDPTEQVVYIQLEGNERVSSVVASIRKLANLPDLPPRGCVLIDLTNNQAIPSVNDIRKIMKEYAHLANNLHGPVAMVARPGFHFGLARMATLIGGNWGFDMCAFTSLEEAEAWLGIKHLPVKEA